MDYSNVIDAVAEHHHDGRVPQTLRVSPTAYQSIFSDDHFVRVGTIEEPWSIEDIQEMDDHAVDRVRAGGVSIDVVIDTSLGEERAILESSAGREVEVEGE